ncbi:MAG: 4-hydroxy-tetrahydrodipicolinate synthase [Parachlamydia sp.]|jgi:4-hydroxy-tetrahydrodipicolinate synthase|nr:4-hydroxy-tetrahydrodipicolinate synthase [Parachlamydia sp.]
MLLKGLYTALITPFTASGILDEEGLRVLIHHQLAHRVDGIVILGTTGEAPTLTQDEKIRIIKIARQAIPEYCHFIVGTGSYSTVHTIEQTLLAESLGADAALIVTPYYNKPTQEGLYRHFEAICRSSSLPICLYNIQGRTGQNLHTNTLDRLTAFSSIIGVKEASGSISQISDVIELAQNKSKPFSVLSGDDALTLPLIALGGQGIVSVLSNLMPGPIKALTEAALQGNMTIAREWHYRLLPLFKAAFIETNPIPIKAAMQLSGLPAGPCRLPLCELQPEHAALLNGLLHEWRAVGS